MMLRYLSLGLLPFSLALQDIPERARGGLAWKEVTSVLKAQNSVKGTWQAKLDNFNPLDNTTFTQKYFVDSQYYDKTNPGPVFYYIGGEGTLTGTPTGYVANLAQNYSALIVALEHRFYGDSVPDSIPDPMTTPNLRYLSVDNALADLAAFTDYYKSSIDPSTKNTPWFVFGGSYPGALASWYRIAHPEHSVGSLSSSGVVNCIVDYTGFDKQVSAAVGNACSDQIRRIQGAFERMIVSADGWTKALKMFYCESDMWKEDFFYMLADSWSMADQYSSKSALCTEILAPGPDATDEVLTQTFADFSNLYWGNTFCAGGFYNTEALSDPKRWESNARSWRWQTCYEVSYFNTAPSSGSLRGAIVDLDYHLRQCAKVFGQWMYPTSEAINNRFGGDAPIAHNVYYSDFSDDPWLRASVDYPVSSDQPFYRVQCDDCGHCKDLHAPADSDPQALKDQRKDFETYLYRWLQKY